VPVTGGEAAARWGRTQTSGTEATSDRHLLRYAFPSRLVGPRLPRKRDRRAGRSDPRDQPK